MCMIKFHNYVTEMLEIYFDGCCDLLDAEKSNMDPKYDLANLTIDRNGYKNETIK